MKRLIINADDCGADEARNAGIFEAIKKGVVTSVSILPNGPAFDDAIQRIKSLNNEKVSWGVHINLSEGEPLSSGLQILAGPDGYFPGKLPAIQLLTGIISTALEREIAIEVEAQIKALSDTGLPVNHLDGHHHAHIFPAVIETVIEMVQKYKIPLIRIPAEPQPSYRSLHISRQCSEEARLFSTHAASALVRINETGIRTTDHFRGLYIKGRLSLSLMEELLEGLSHGLTELMLHPGRAEKDHLYGPFSGFSTQDREKELTTLLHPEFHLLLKRSGVILAPFPEI
ncbi:MAG: ChbG/HpnK family deacetylase [Proteobacteria bacterium]|nr:ChbG/HpnK family deacetylase [Pseudomonadota bacterium]